MAYSQSADAPTTDPRHQHARFGAIVTGALVCLSLQIVFTVLGSAIGLSAFQFEQGDRLGQGIGIGAMIYGVLSLIVSFFVGGYVAAKLANAASRSISMLHGLGSWALVAVFAVFFAASSAVSSIGGVLQTAGIASSSATGINAIMEELGKANLRLVSDVRLSDGEIVTTLVSDRSAGAIPNRVAKNVQKDTDRGLKKAQSTVQQQLRDPQTRETVGDVRKAAASASWAALGVLLITGLSSIFGGFFPSRGMSVAKRRADVDYRPRRAA